MPARAIKHIGNKTKSRIQTKRRNEVGRGKDRLLSAGVFENGRGNASVTKKSTLARGLSPRKEPVLNLRASATNRDIRKKRAEEKKRRNCSLSPHGKMREEAPMLLIRTLASRKSSFPRRRRAHTTQCEFLIPLRTKRRSWPEVSRSVHSRPPLRWYGRTDVPRKTV